MTQTDSMPEIDFDHLNLYVDGNSALTAEIFGMFKHQIEMWGRALIPDADDDTWASVTHSLKGSAKAVGAVALADLCEQAEGFVGTGNRPGLREYSVQNIEFRISRVLTEIQRWEYDHMIKQMKA